MLRLYFIKCIPWSNIQTLTQKKKVINSSSHSQKRMATRDQQDQEREGDRVKHPDGQSVGLHVVDGDERLVVLPHKLLTELQADPQTQGHARLHSGGYSWELARVNMAPL